jgi:hypothetical protein
MSATSLQIRPGLHHCRVRGRTIFLDVPANRYFALSARLDSCFQAFADPGDENVDASAMDHLQALGILVPVAPSAKAVRASAEWPPAARRSAVATQAATAASVEFLALYLRAMAELRFSSLEGALRRRAVAAARRRTITQTEHIVGQIVAAARRADGIFSSHRRCLPRSIAIFDMLVARGLVPRIVIGVGDTAFSGHCWIQHDEMVVGDLAETVRLFTPILTI